MTGNHASNCLFPKLLSIPSSLTLGKCHMFECYKEIYSIRYVQDVYDALLSQLIISQVNAFNFELLALEQRGPYTSVYNMIMRLPSDISGVLGCTLAQNDVENSFVFKVCWRCALGACRFCSDTRSCLHLHTDFSST